MSASAGKASNGPEQVRRADYQVPPLLVDQVRLRVRIEEHTRVESVLQLRRNPAASPDAPLWLDGRELTLESIQMDGRTLQIGDYQLTPNGLTLQDAPDQFELRVLTEIDPEHNDSLEGLYRSGAMICTQCEAHGFSRLTFYPDRPDVLARFEVRIEAAKASFPVLLSNGNRVAEGDLGQGFHYVEWSDPYPKPCYLFAMVAGSLALIEDQYQTASGRQVALHFYVDPGNEAQAGHAIASLKQAMRWDEEAYGLEYDLDLYQVVAARDFNMGAMENKGLNLFNARFVLASPETATDEDYEQIRAVIGHEYFHNWTGNRVTCRDWFQLSLKEGLTVLREQQFCEAMESPGVQRIRQVQYLRSHQFPEDAGPLAHPVRPEAYAEVNNFYTLTVYEKGAELLRMIRTLVGPETFTRGVQTYLKTFDGQAATIDDFLDVQERIAAVSLDGMRRWYSQAGTPVLEVEEHYADGCLTLTVRQQHLPSPGQPDKQCVPVPVRLRLRDAAGQVVCGDGDGELRVLESAEDEWRFEGLSARPMVSLLLGFSAPVRLHYPRPIEHLAALVLVETDPFCRWDAAQQLMTAAFLEHVGEATQGGEATDALVDALQRLAAQPPADLALLAELLRLPSAGFLMEQLAPSEPLLSQQAYLCLRRKLASALTGPLSVWAGWEPAGLDADAVARRTLACVAMEYLGALPELPGQRLLMQRATRSENMSLIMGALQGLNDQPGVAREAAMEALHQRGEAEALVLDKWFSLQASAADCKAAGIRHLMKLPSYQGRNPNRVRAVLGAFARRNLAGFHARDGSGYALLAEQILHIDQSNPQLAARLADPFSRWRRFAEPYAGLQREQLERLQDAAHSTDLREIVARALE